MATVQQRHFCATHSSWLSHVQLIYAVKKERAQLDTDLEDKNDENTPSTSGSAGPPAKSECIKKNRKTEDIFHKIKDELNETAMLCIHAIEDLQDQTDFACSPRAFYQYRHDKLLCGLMEIEVHSSTQVLMSGLRKLKKHTENVVTLKKEIPRTPFLFDREKND